MAQKDAEAARAGLELTDVHHEAQVGHACAATAAGGPGRTTSTDNEKGVGGPSVGGGAAQRANQLTAVVANLTEQLKARDAELAVARTVHERLAAVTADSERAQQRLLETYGRDAVVAARADVRGNHALKKESRNRKTIGGNGSLGRG